MNNEELKIQATVLRQEAEKLSSWRKKAVYELIGSPESSKDKIGKEHIYQAALLSHEHYSNQAYKDGLVRTHVIFLYFMLTITISILFLLSYKELLKFNLEPPFERAMLIPAAILGLLGGTFSAIIKVPDSSKSSRIPELTSSIRVTLIRIFMGAASAIIIYIFLNSKIAESFFKGVFEFYLSKITSATVFVITFISGFSERLVLRAVEFVAKEKK